MNQEKEYLNLLKTTETFEIQDGKLTITCSDNRMMVFATQTVPQIYDSADARDAALSYLREHVRKDVPVTGTS